VKKRLYILVGLSLSFLSGQASPDTDPEWLPRLQAGEIIVRSVREFESGGAARFVALMHAPARQVWETLLSCEQAMIYVDGIRSCEVLEWVGNRSRTRQVVKRPWPFGELDIVFESHYTPHREVESRMVEGNLKLFETRWTFEPVDDYLLVEYAAHLQPALPAPKLLVRHYLRKKLPDLLACLRGLADASGTPELESEDLARCPNDPTGETD
jgi:hypothetical protein